MSDFIFKHPYREITIDELRIYDAIFLNKNGEELFKGISKNIKKYILNQYKKGEVIIFDDRIWSTLTDSSQTDFTKSSFYIRNTARINEDGTLKDEVFKEIQKEFFKIRNSNRLIKGEDAYNDVDEEIVVKKDKKFATKYKINPSTDITQINRALYDSSGDCLFKYDFDSLTNKHILPLSIPNGNIKKLQHFKIKVNSVINDYCKKVRLEYRCEKCGYVFHKSINDVESTNGKTKCRNNLGNEQEKKICGQALSNPTMNSITTTIYCYDVHYMNDRRETVSIIAESLIPLENYEYECVGLMLDEDTVSKIFILDLIEIPKKKLIFEPNLEIREDNAKDIIPEIINYFDDYIYKWSGDKIVGMIDLKFAFYCQKLTETFKFPLNDNIALVGDKGVGKTYLCDHMGIILYGGSYKDSEGKSISIPSLRGSSKGNIDVKKGNKNRPGLLCTCRCITIDEVNNNPELMDELKSFLLKQTFSNDKADGDKIQRKRTAHVNITENPEEEHISLYIGKIKKLYNNVRQDPRLKYENSEHFMKEDFNERWDLFQHLHTYENPYLRHAIKTVREEYTAKKVSFLDGHSLSVHDRFPFYYVINTGNADTLKERSEVAVKKILGRKVENQTEYVDKLRYDLSCDNVDLFFKRYEQFYVCPEDEEPKSMSIIANKIYNLIVSYGFVPESRLVTQCTTILKYSRTFNQRMVYSEVDYNWVKRFLHMRERVVKLEEMNEFKVVEPQNISITNKLLEEIKETIHFGKISDDEFK